MKVQIKDALKIVPKTCKIEQVETQDKQKIMQNKNKLLQHIFLVCFAFLDSSVTLVVVFLIVYFRYFDTDYCVFIRN